MTEAFGERLKTHYLERIAQVRARTDSNFNTVYLQYSYHGEFEGLSTDEIEQLRAAQNVPEFPTIYVEFLRTMGRKAGGIFVGCNIRFEDQLKLKRALLYMMAQNRQVGAAIPELPAQAYVFLAIQGADFFFFEADSGQDDPPVYYYPDGGKKFHEVTAALSTWLWEQAFDPTADTEKFLNV